MPAIDVKQSLLLFKVATDPFIKALTHLVGLKEVESFCAKISPDIFFKKLRIEEDGVNIDDLITESGALTLEHVSASSQQLLYELYELTSRTFSKERADEILNNTYSVVKKSHKYEQVGAYLENIPKNFFEEDRLTFLGRDALEKLVIDRTKELKIAHEQELAKNAELLRLKDEFVFVATHDLRTPVVMISGYVSLMNEQRNSLSADQIGIFDAISEGAKRLNQLVNDLLQVAQSDNGTIKLELASVDIVKLIEQVHKELELPAQEKGVTFELLMDKTNRMIVADEEKMIEVLENLFSNAVKYNKNKGKVIVSTSMQDKTIVITIEDTGLGIPEAQQQKVFQKFFRAEMKNTRDISGTGLGLFVVKMLIEKMNGALSFSSQEGIGTTFTISMRTP